MTPYTKALAIALDMMDSSDIEPTSALKQSALDLGISYGEPMRKFVEWAYQQPPFSKDIRMS